MLEKEKPIKGILTINIPFARGLKIADEKSSDPYCKIIYPDGKSISS